MSEILNVGHRSTYRIGTKRQNEIVRATEKLDEE